MPCWQESQEAIPKPIEVAECPVRFHPDSVKTICREVFDVFIQQQEGDPLAPLRVDAIQRKLDADFFAGRWAKVTDRQRELLWVVANLDRSDEEFTILELVDLAKRLLLKPFSPSHANQMLAGLAERGMIYKNRLGRYSFAVPLLGRFILGTHEAAVSV
jgi:hypothetical protein